MTPDGTAGSTPPPAGWVLARAAELGRTDAGVLAHLLTPTDVTVGIGVQVHGKVVSYRGRAVRVPREPGAAVAVLRNLAVAAALPGDTYLPVTARGGQLLKVVPSGAHVLLAGSVELFSGPRVQVAAAVASGGLLAALADGVAAGHLPAPGAVLPAFGAAVSGGTDRLIFDALEAAVLTAAGGIPDLLRSAAALCARTAADVGAVDAHWVPHVDGVQASGLAGPRTSVLVRGKVMTGTGTALKVRVRVSRDRRPAVDVAPWPDRMPATR